MSDRIKRLLDPLEPLPTDMEPRLDPLPGIRAVLFDVYGTLLVSGSGDVGTAEAFDNTKALAGALAAVGLNPDAARSGIAKFFDCVRADHLVGKAKGIEYPEIEVRDVWRRTVDADADTIEALAIEYECRANPVWPMPGFPEITGPLRERNLCLGIVSNAQFYTPVILESLLDQPLSQLGFDRDLCAWSYRQGCAKPAPDLFAPILQRLQSLHIDPDQAVYVGNDMLNDMFTASQCGLRSVLFAGDRRSLRLRPTDPRCKTLQPDAIITRLDQLPPLLPES